MAVTISDFENQTCTASAIFEKICCDEECVIGDIYIKELECTSDSTYAFYLKFTYENNSSKVFSLNVDDQYHGIFNVDQLPIKISGIKLDGSKNDSIKICMDEGECCKSKEYAVPVCEFEDCKIENVVWTPIYDTIAGKFWIKIDFAHENTSESFNIKGNGKYYGSFNYESLPVILGSYKCNDSLDIEYIIRDNKYELCKAIIEPGVIKCPTSTNFEINADDKWKIFNVTGENILDILSDNEITKNGNIEIYNLVGIKVFSSKINDGLNEFSIRIPVKNERAVYCQI